MSDDTKRLMNEVLPDPRLAAQQSGPARARVLKHLRRLAIAGASLTLGPACPPYAVVDPLPPPAKCRTGKVVDGVTGTAALLGVAPDQYVEVSLGWSAYDELTVNRVLGVVNGTLRDVHTDSSSAVLQLSPAAGATTVQADLDVSCSGMSGRTMRVVVTLAADGGALAVILSEVGGDGGP